MKESPTGAGRLICKMEDLFESVAQKKRLWTSCYGRARFLPPAWAQVQTSRMSPFWWNPSGPKLNLPYLAPKSETLAAAKSGKEWKPAYRDQLEELFQSGSLKKYVDLLPDDAVLLCYEGDENQCHRGILSEFLNDRGLAEVAEWKRPESKKVESQKNV